ncbi:L-histidine N(alpha)-methyltransferase [Tumidithrix elongata RA019]|uniref:L-histidine N(Alpha)-methyltransferase n=1 Tax=Tumidithrix elongata BACA0141 TaxID=2716417 RepID=A0AAW9Q2B9_9CYAN|nr:L-histidine N(alpha)-methyltransferase [Tumidithrix elongata RA019]
MFSSKTTLPALGDRLRLERLINATDKSLTSGHDVVAGLSKTPKTLPAKYFYDDLGSQLFEQICELPEYYLTRTETAILQTYAVEIAQLTGSCELVELGSGSATKTRILLDAYDQLGYPLRYMPIDISAGILESSAFALLADYPTLEVHGLVSTYEQALQRLNLPQLPTRMLCFLGSTLGNLNLQECDLFFEQVAGALRIGEYFLLGVDLKASALKPKSLIHAAYNDAQAVSAAFNLNMLSHLNHKFDGNFDLATFQHSAIYNERSHQVEMYLTSTKAQTISLRSLLLTTTLQSGEAILTEISRKFDLQQLEADLSHKGLHKIRVWTDPNQWFALILCQLKG